MAIAVASFILVLSVVVAVLSKRGTVKSNLSDMLISKGSFGMFLVFFISVGEIYGIGTMVGVPGALYSQGITYGMWYCFYVLLAYCVGYFLNPLSLRLGQVSKSVTTSDMIGWRFNSKGLEILIACVSIFFMVFWIQLQFSGMGILIQYLNLGIDYRVITVLSILIAFSYIAIAGIKAPAWVSILKDTLLITTVVGLGIAATAAYPGGVHGIFTAVAEKAPEKLILTNNLSLPFIISTVIFQMFGFYLLPFTMQGVLTSKNEKILRKNSILMPLYMMFFPFLVIVAYFSILTQPNLERPDFALLATAMQIVPDWMIGIIIGGGVLTSILAMAFVSLAVAGMVSKSVIGNIKPNTSGEKMTKIARTCSAVFLIVSALMSLLFPTLLLDVVTISYTGLTQMGVAFLFAFFWKGGTKQGVAAGLAAGLIVIVYIKFGLLGIVPFGLNMGAFAFCINLLVACIVSKMTKPDDISLQRFNDFQAMNPLNRVKTN